MMENPNGFSTTISGNKKLEKEKEVIDDLDPNVVAFRKSKVNCQYKLHCNGFRQMF